MRAAFASSPSLTGPLSKHWRIGAPASGSDHAAAPQWNGASSRRLQAAPLGDPQAPGPDRRPLAGAGKHYVGRSEERRAGEGIAGSADATSHVRLSGLVLSRRQTQMRADIARAADARRSVDRRLERQCRDRPDAGDGHDPAAEVVVGRETQQGPVKFGALRLHLGAPATQCGQAEFEVWVPLHELAHSGLEVTRGDAPDLQPERTWTSTDPVLVVAQRVDEELA